MADLKTLAAAASTAATAPPPKRARKKPAATPSAKPKRTPKEATQAAAAAEVNVLVASATADGLRAMAGERGLPTGGKPPTARSGYAELWAELEGALDG